MCRLFSPSCFFFFLATMRPAADKSRAPPPAALSPARVRVSPAGERVALMADGFLSTVKSAAPSGRDGGGADGDNLFESRSIVNIIFIQ